MFRSDFPSLLKRPTYFLLTMRFAPLSSLFLIPAISYPLSQAAFREDTQVVQLSYGQREAVVVFIADGTITRSRSLCDCTRVSHSGNRLTATVDVSDFARSVRKQIEATTADGTISRLTMDIRVPQAVELSAQSLIWKVGSAAEEKLLQIRIPKGSPVRRIISADLSGDAFHYTTRTEEAGALYSVSVTPLSTQKRALNRLIIRTDSVDPRYAASIIYLSVQP